MRHCNRILSCRLQGIVAMVLMLVYTGQANAIDLSTYDQIRYVSVSTGSDLSGDGSRESPWMSLDFALNRIVDAGSTNRYAMLVASGVYAATDWMEFTMKSYVDLCGGFDPMTWSRETATGKTVLDGENTRRGISIASHTILDGFIITNGYDYSGAGISAGQVSSAVINNCTITGNTAILDGGGLNLSYKSSITVNQCVIQGNTSLRNGGGIVMYSITNIVLTNCIIYDNIASVYGAAVDCSDASPSFVNCTIVNNHGSGIGCEGDSYPQILNCILWNRGAEIIGGDPLIDSCCIQGGWDADGVINSLPMFVDSEEGDFHLLDESPCIDRGNDSYAPDVDYEGNPRPKGAHIDMGSYEAPDEYVQGVVSEYIPVRRYVRWEAPEGGDGHSWQTAHKTIRQALDQVDGGDEVWVSEGTYNEGIILEPSMSLYGGFSGTEDSLSERDLKANHTIVDASGAGVSVVVCAPETRVNSFSLKNGAAVYGGGINCTGVSSRIENCIISRNYASEYAGGLYCKDSSLILSNSILAYNAADLSEGSAITCDNSIISITHCSLVGNAGGQGNAIKVDSSSTANLTNCIIWNPGPEIQGEHIQVTYSCVQGGWDGTGNINCSPKFVDPESEDFHLQDGSPCVGRATTDTDLLSDIEGNPRVAGAAPDMGAYEAPANYEQGDVGGYSTRHYVRASAPEGGDGTSWDTAFKTITQALWLSWPGDEIWVAEGHYHEGIILEPSMSLYAGFQGTESSLLERNWRANVTIINATGLSRQVVYGADRTILDGFTFKGGDPTGVDCSFAKMRLSNCVITYNRNIDYSDGSGIRCQSATMELENCTISHNSSHYRAGGISCKDTSMTLSRCSLFNNVSMAEGGGLYSANSILTVTDCRIFENSVGMETEYGFLTGGEGGGAGVYCKSSTVSFSSCTISDNTAPNDGGGLYFGASSALVKDCTIQENSSSSFNGGGGGINLTNSTGILANSIIRGNTATGLYRGGGLYCSGSPVKITGCTFIENTRDGVDFIASAAEMVNCQLIGNTGAGIYSKTSPGPFVNQCVISKNIGAGVFCLKCDAVISDCTLSENGSNNSSAKGGSVYCEGIPSATFEKCHVTKGYVNYGGGFYINNSSPMIYDCEIVGNTAYIQGGGIYTTTKAYPTIKNCVIQSNTAERGGGLYSGSSGLVQMINCTLCNNTSSVGSYSGGGLYSSSKTTMMTNCVLWNDQPKEISGLSIYDDLVQYSDIQGGFTGTGNIDSDPLFVDPANGNFHLQEGSPCIGKGIGPELNSLVPLFDFEGDPRTGATCDIGADEYTGPTMMSNWAQY